MLERRAIQDNFVEIRNLSKDQVSALIQECLELTEQINEELPLILDSYKEVAEEKEKKSRAQKVIGTVLSNSFKKIDGSDTLFIIKEAIKYKLDENKQTEDDMMQQFFGTIKLLMPNGNTLNTNIEKFKGLLDAEDFGFYTLPVNVSSGLTPFGFPWQLKASGLNLNSGSVRRAGIRNFLLNEITIDAGDIEQLLDPDFFKNRDDLEPFPDLQVEYFKDKRMVLIILEMLRNPQAKESLRWLVCKTIYNNIKNITAKHDIKFELPEFSQEQEREQISWRSNEDSLSAEELFTHFCDHSISEITSRAPIDQDANWAKLANSIDLFLSGIRELVKSRSEAFRLYFGDENKMILNTIYNFLIENNLNPLTIPTINELGSYKGGYALVKSISLAGGLKNVRKDYIPWVTEVIKTLD